MTRLWPTTMRPAPDEDHKEKIHNSQQMIAKDSYSIRIKLHSGAGRPKTFAELFLARLLLYFTMIYPFM